MCTFGSKSRRPLDPLPIVQLEVVDKDGNVDELGPTSPFLVMQVSALTAPPLEKKRDKKRSREADRDTFSGGGWSRSLVTAKRLPRRNVCSL